MVGEDQRLLETELPIAENKALPGVVRPLLLDLEQKSTTLRPLGLPTQGSQCHLKQHLPTDLRSQPFVAPPTRVRLQVDKCTLHLLSRDLNDCPISYQEVLISAGEGMVPVFEIA